MECDFACSSGRGGGKGGGNFLEWKMVRKAVLWGSLAAALLISGCNTVGGVGRDLESVGETVSDAAR